MAKNAAIGSERLLDNILELLEVIPESAFIADSSGLIVSSNTQLENLFGYTREELQGKQLEMLIPENHRSQHIKKREQFIKSPHTQIMGEGKYIYGLHKTGKEIPIEVRLGSYKTQEGVFVISMVTDVTKRYWAHKHLKEKEERLRVIMESTRAIPWAADPVTWAFTYVGPQAVEILGYPVEHWYTKDFWVNKMHPEDREATIKFCADSSKKLSNYEFEYRMLKSNGDVVWLRDVVHVEFKNGKPCTLRGFLIDVTAYKLSDQQLKEQKQFTDQLRNELAHVNRLSTMGELTASIAHELNQPLTAIMSNSQAAQQFLTKQSPDLEEINDVLTDIVSDDRRAGEIIKRLRKLLVKGETELVSLNLAELIEDVVKLIRNEAKNKHVDISFETVSTALPLVVGDRIQLQQVVLNLILNAFDAMENVENVTRKLIIKLVKSSNDQYRVDFVDSGMGLLKQEPEQLFKAFNTSKNNGMGMGLTISRTIIEAHGGKLGALQNKEAGATFYFSLPPISEEPA